MGSLIYFRSGILKIPVNRSALIVVSVLDVIRSKSSNVDVFDTFTREFLSQRRNSNVLLPQNELASKETKSLLSKITLHQSSGSSCDIQSLCQSELDAYVKLTIDNDDRDAFNRIIDQIFIQQKLPSDEVILIAMKYLCDEESDSLAQITKLIDVCKVKNLKFYATNTHFLPYLGQYLWQLKEYNHALNTLRAIYRSDDEIVKNNVKYNFHRIVKDCVTNRLSDALDGVEEFAVEVAKRNKNLSLLKMLWIECFISDWFDDQTRANDLFDRFVDLRDSFAPEIGMFTFETLQKHKVDPVYRLIELCLRFEMRKECRVCLSMMFDYQCELTFCPEFEHFSKKCIFIFRLESRFARLC